jgi:hypothetical protein
MAGETSKTTALTNAQASPPINREARLNRGRVREGSDLHAFTTGQLEAADVLLTNIDIPSNAIVREVLMYNDDLDSNATPTLTFDIGVAAGEDFTSTTSSSDTKHSEDDVLDADLFVDGDTTAQAATTKYTSLALDSATAGPDDADKPIWEKLGYDNDPLTKFRIVVTTSAAAATAAAGDVSLLVRYTVD